MIVIPARLKSTRLENKLLLPLGDEPIIIRVAKIAKNIDRSIVATDSKEIADVCKKYDIEYMMTSPNHTSGTDRCAEVVDKLDIAPNEVVINLQGDEPFIESNVILELKKAMQLQLDSSSDTFMASCYKLIDKKLAGDSNLVKVVLNENNFALYFSRSKIPYYRESRESEVYYGHLGIYAFSKKSLLEFCNLAKSPLEEIEKLEQLRALWHNKKIYMLKVDSNSIGIDNIDDYNLALSRI